MSAGLGARGVLSLYRCFSERASLLVIITGSDLFYEFM